MNRETLLGVTLMIISTLVPGSRGISCVACGCSVFSKQLHCSGICPGPGSPVQTVHCPRGYCHSFTTYGSGDNVSITRNCYNKHEDPVQYWSQLKDDTDGRRVVNRCYTLNIMGHTSTECLCDYHACNSRGTNIQNTAFIVSLLVVLRCF